MYIFGGVRTLIECDMQASSHDLCTILRDPESSNILDYCDDAVIVVPGLPEKEADVLCNSFILKEQVILV